MRGVCELSEENHVFREFLQEQGEREVAEDGEESGSEDENENEQRGEGEKEDVRVALAGAAGNTGEGAGAGKGAAVGPAADVAVGVDGESA